jgi:hypothetical protein
MFKKTPEWFLMFFFIGCKGRINYEEMGKLWGENFGI